MVRIKKELFGTTQNNNIYKLILENDNKMKVSFLNLGATNFELIVPDNNLNLVDVSLQYENLDNIYLNPTYLGAVVAMNCNRIEGGEFKLSDKIYKLEVDANNNNIHSIPNVLKSKILDYEMKNNNDGSASLLFKYNFKDMEQGFPGDTEFYVKYTLNDNNELIINFSATSNKDTIFNPTSHMYYNLSGQDKNDLSEQYLCINSDKYLEVNENFIPKNIKEVKNTPFDFTKEKCILENINDNHEQLKVCNGYDHCYLINDNKDGNGLKKVAYAYSKITGIRLDIISDSEAVQLYTANFIGNDLKGKNGVIYKKKGAFCLETEFVPNSINDYRFTKPILKANIHKEFTTILKFSA